MKHHTLWIFAAAAIACGHSPVDDDDTSRDGLMADGAALWPEPENLKVCWEAGDAADTPSYAVEREWVKSALARSWSAENPRIRFSGFGACTNGSPGIHVRVGAHPHGANAVDRGKWLDGVDGGVNLVFDFDEQEAKHPAYRGWYATCRTSETARRTCLEYEAVHEFGHALGLRHEQDRSETPTPCTLEAHADAQSGVVTGTYDPDSIMNYCKRDRKDAGGSLSKGDRDGIRRLYPAIGGAPQVDPNIGRPLVEIAPTNWPTSSNGNETVGGWPATVTVTYPDVTDARRLPSPKLVIMDAAETFELAGTTWQPATRRPGEKGLVTTATWTPRAGAMRPVRVRWAEREYHAGTVRRFAAFSSQPAPYPFEARVGARLEVPIAVLFQPGIPPAASVTARGRTERGEEIQFTASCAPAVEGSLAGLQCAVSSVDPLLEKGALVLVVDAAAEGLSGVDATSERSVDVALF